MTEAIRHAQTSLSNPALARLAAFVGAWQWEVDFDLTYTRVG